MPNKQDRLDEILDLIQLTQTGGIKELPIMEITGKAQAKTAIEKWAKEQRSAVISEVRKLPQVWICEKGHTVVCYRDKDLKALEKKKDE